MPIFKVFVKEILFCCGTDKVITSERQLCRVCDTLTASKSHNLIEKGFILSVLLVLEIYYKFIFKGYLFVCLFFFCKNMGYKFKTYLQVV